MSASVAPFPFLKQLAPQTGTTATPKVNPHPAFTSSNKPLAASVPKPTPGAIPGKALITPPLSSSITAKTPTTATATPAPKLTATATPATINKSQPANTNLDGRSALLNQAAAPPKTQPVPQLKTITAATATAAAPPKTTPAKTATLPPPPSITTATATPSPLAKASPVKATIAVTEKKSAVVPLVQPPKHVATKGAPDNEGTYRAAPFLNGKEVEDQMTDEHSFGQKPPAGSKEYLDAMKDIFKPMSDYFTNAAKRAIESIECANSKQAEWFKNVITDTDRYCHNLSTEVKAMSELHQKNYTAIGSHMDSLATVLSETNKTMKILSGHFDELKHKAVVSAEEPVATKKQKKADGTPVISASKPPSRASSPAPAAKKTITKAKKAKEQDPNHTDSDAESGVTASAKQGKRKRLTKTKEVEEKKSEMVIGIDPVGGGTASDYAIVPAGEEQPEDQPPSPLYEDRDAYLFQYIQEDKSKRKWMVNVGKAKKKSYEWGPSSIHSTKKAALKAAMDAIRDIWPKPENYPEEQEAAEVDPVADAIEGQQTTEGGDSYDWNKDEQQQQEPQEGQEEQEQQEQAEDVDADTFDGSGAAPETEVEAEEYQQYQGQQYTDAQDADDVNMAESDAQQQENGVLSSIAGEDDDEAS